jgi:AraC-like DNA-binding protein
MLRTLIPSATAAHPLQIDFVQVGRVGPLKERLSHLKTIPYTILAQTLEGAYEVRCQGRHAVVPPEGIFVIPANTPVEIVHHPTLSGMRARWLHVRYSYHGVLDFLSFYDTPLQLPAEPSRQIGDEIETVLKLQATPWHPGLPVLMHEAATRVLGILCNASAVNEQALRLESRQQRLLPVLNYLRNHLADALSVADLATVACLSPVHFHALFKDAFGVSPMRYLRSIRLDTASRMLAATDEPVARIAEANGFADAFHFSHAFSKRFGLSPRAYRQQIAE